MSSRYVLKHVLTLSNKVGRVIRPKNRSLAPTFSSFVVEINRDEIQLVDDLTKWPTGVSVRPFYGLVRDDQIETADSPKTEQVVSNDD